MLTQKAAEAIDEHYGHREPMNHGLFNVAWPHLVRPRKITTLNFHTDIGRLGCHATQASTKPSHQVRTELPSPPSVSSSALSASCVVDSVNFYAIIHTQEDDLPHELRQPRGPINMRNINI